LLALQLSAQRGAPGDAPASGFRGRHLLAAALAGGALAAGIRLFAPGQWNIMAATVAAATLVLVLEHRWTSDRKS
jgi:hypothetical protein